MYFLNSARAFGRVSNNKLLLRGQNALLCLKIMNWLKPCFIERYFLLHDTSPPKSITCHLLLFPQVLVCHRDRATTPIFLFSFIWRPLHHLYLLTLDKLPVVVLFSLSTKKGNTSIEIWTVDVPTKVCVLRYWWCREQGRNVYNCIFGASFSLVVSTQASPSVVPISDLFLH